MKAKLVGALCAGILVAAVSGPTPVVANGDNFFMDNPGVTEPGVNYFGFVRDDKGKAVSGAEVAIHLKLSGKEFSATSNGVGIWQNADVGMSVRPENVQITASKAGYELVTKIDRTKVTVPGLPVQVDFVLKAKP